jgi:hypothetical protein
VTDVIKADAKKTIGNEPVEKAPEINVALLRGVLEYIKAHPQTWQQESWFWVVNPDGKFTPHVQTVTVEEVNSCETAFCFAGHAAIIEGFPMPPHDNYKPWERFVSDTSHGVVGWGEYEGKAGYVEGVDAYAAKVLGLDYDVAEELFSAGNTLEDLEKMVEYLEECAKTGEVPDWYTLSEIRGEEEYDDYSYEDED